MCCPIRAASVFAVRLFVCSAVRYHCLQRRAFTQDGHLKLVRPALMLKSTEIFEYERKRSQRTKSVAKLAGGLNLVQPITKHE